MRPIWNPSSVAWIVFFSCLLYAILRYHVAKDVSWSHLPLWTTNKAVALVGVLLICAAYCNSRFGTLESWSRWFGLTGFLLAAIHTLASLLLFSPAAYPKFFVEATMELNAVGELSMLLGVAALACFSGAAITSLPGVKSAIRQEVWKRWQKIGLNGFVITIGHVVVMGMNVDPAAWFSPAKWPKIGPVPLPSISLLASIAAIGTLIARRIRKRVPS